MAYALIVSSLSERYYYDAFVKECSKMNVQVGILDPEFFIANNHAINVRLGPAGPQGYIELVELGQDSNSTITVDIRAIKIAWHLRVARTLRVSEIKEPEKRFKWSETLAAINSFLSVLECEWINTYEDIERLNCNKLLQQVHAAGIGLLTPETVMSNIPDSITGFCEERDDYLLLKTIGYTSIDDDGQLVIYSEMFDTRELQEAQSAIRTCPVYSQKYVPKLYEYRVMVIGGEVHACRIDSQSSEKTTIDWRHYDFDNVAHTACELPTDVSDKLLAFMRSVQLSYGAIDMIETPNGEFVFLEVNPSGQWDWISKLAGLPIAESAARMLARFAL